MPAVLSIALAVMAEALGGIASVLTIVESLAHVTKSHLSCKNAPKESKRLVRELSYIRDLLTTLKENIQEQESSNTSWSSTLLLLSDRNGFLHQFQKLVAQLDQRIGGPSREHGFSKLKRALEWPFKETETRKLMETIE